MNLESVKDYVKILGPFHIVWEGNIHGEKHKMIGKEEFTAQREDNHG